MASSWIVLHAGHTIECDECREAVKVASRRGLIRKYNVPAFTLPASLVLPTDGTDHAYVVLGVANEALYSGVVTSALCNPIEADTLRGAFRVYPFANWSRGWKRPAVRQYLELMALANESEEKVWQDWQQAIMMTALSGPEGIWKGTKT